MYKKIEKIQQLEDEGNVADLSDEIELDDVLVAMYAKTLVLKIKTKEIGGVR